MYNFSESQKQVFEKYLKDENVFITGPGGSGKSYLIKCIYHDAIEKHKNIKICALTGCASILLGCKATTLHRFAGIGLANKSIDEVVSFVFKNKYKLKAWYSLNILIIDEVSMMSLKLLLILDKIARRIYNRSKLPFGGLQVIFSGDFYQLPPVNSNDEEKEAGMFCFEHELWNQIFPKDNQIILKTIFRQEEENFLKILRYVRKGKITPTTKKMLEDKVYTEKQLDKIREEKVVTIINPYRKDTDYINNKYYNELPKDAEKNIYNLRYLKL